MNIYRISRPPYVERFKLITDADPQYFLKIEQFENKLENSLYKDSNGKLYFGRLIAKLDCSDYDYDMDSNTINVLSRKTKFIWNYVALPEE